MDDWYDWIRKHEDVIRHHQETLRQLAESPHKDYLAAIENLSLSKAMADMGTLAAVPSLAAGIAAMTSEALHRMSMSGAMEEMFRVLAERDQTLSRLGQALLEGELALTASRVKQIISTVDLAGATLAGINWDRLGKAVEIGGQCQRQLQFLTNELASSHASLIEKARMPEGGFGSFPEFVTRVPTENLFVHSRTMRVWSQHDDYQDDEERQSTTREEEIDDDTDRILGSLLGIVNPEYPKMLNGVDDAWQNKHSDWQRHAAVSLRELFKDLLHKLAPNDEVMKFVTDPKSQLDDHGRPTRATKVAWLCRFVGLTDYRRVVEVDLMAAVECIELLVC